MCVCLFVYICVSAAFSLLVFCSWLVCFILVYLFGRVAFLFSKERERKVWSWMDEEVQRIWEEMRKGKL